MAAAVVVTMIVGLGTTPGHPPDVIEDHSHQEIRIRTFLEIAMADGTIDVTDPGLRLLQEILARLHQKSDVYHRAAPLAHLSVVIPDVEMIAETRVLLQGDDLPLQDAIVMCLDRHLGRLVVIVVALVPHLVPIVEAITDAACHHDAVDVPLHRLNM